MPPEGLRSCAGIRAASSPVPFQFLLITRDGCWNSLLFLAFSSLLRWCTDSDVACIGLLTEQAPFGLDSQHSRISSGFLTWWLDPVSILSRVPFEFPQPSIMLVSNASDLGWEAHLGNLRTQGLWSEDELSLHINVKELRAILMACEVFLAQFSGKSVQVFPDKTVSMFYVNK